LSEAVQGAIDQAVDLIEGLVAEFVRGPKNLLATD
jgi:hypothetical protein